MQAKPLATNLGEQANKIAVSVQSGDGDILTLWGMCRRYAMQQATRWLRAFESGGVELDDLEQSAFIGLLKAVQTRRYSAQRARGRQQGTSCRPRMRKAYSQGRG